MLQKIKSINKKRTMTHSSASAFNTSHLQICPHNSSILILVNIWTELCDYLDACHTSKSHISSNVAKSEVWLWTKSWNILLRVFPPLGLWFAPFSLNMELEVFQLVLSSAEGVKGVREWDSEMRLHWAGSEALCCSSSLPLLWVCAWNH